jgi:hypothetical protein
VPVVRTIAIIGAGPRGAGVLERLGANADVLQVTHPVTVHLIDPHPPGAGRVWRYAQSPLLRMNSMAEDVTMFTDDSVTCAGPIRPGPSLSQWAEQVRAGEIAVELSEDVRAEIDALTGTAFATRRTQSAYLAWFFHDTVAGLPPNFEVRVHADTVAKVVGDEVRLAGTGEPIVADVVIFALGHLDSRPDREQARIQDYAKQNGLFYLPPEYSADADLSGIRPGQDVLVRGIGLAFIDLMVLLTEGRGGKFRTEADGTLTYLPSGEEPRLYVGSRRGVPYHSKTGYRLKAGRPPLPRFFGPDAIRQLLELDELDFHEHVWPLMAKDIAWGHYHELVNGHPDRVATTWPEFAARFAELAWDSAEMRQLIAATIQPDDRLDFAALDRPLATERFGTFEELQQHMRNRIRADVDRRSDDHYSQDLGAFTGLLSAFGNLAAVAASGKLTTTSYIRGISWWMGFFNFLASGPPGADTEISTVDGVYRARSSSSPAAITATALIEARLPKPVLDRTGNELLRSLYESGDATPEVLQGPRHETGRHLVTPADLRLVDSEGRPHPRRFALGAPTSVVAVAAFARPHTNAPAFRQNDTVARAILTMR